MASSCAQQDPGETTSVTLVNIDGWARDDEGPDPFGPPPADAVCDAGFSREGLFFEVDTGVCTWGTFVQPSLAPISKGEELEFSLVHDALVSDVPGASAHLGVALGSEIAWELDIPIPSEGSFTRYPFVAPSDAPVGTPIRFHIDNHGINQYRIVDLVVHSRM